MPSGLTGITIVCQDACSVDLHLRSGSAGEDKEFYYRATRFPNPEFRYLEVVPGEKIMEIAVRNFQDTGVGLPCIAVRTSNGRDATFGPYNPTDRRQYHGYSPIFDLDNREVSCLCVNEVDLKDPYIQIGVIGRVGTNQMDAHSGIFWDKLDADK